MTDEKLVPAMLETLPGDKDCERDYDGVFAVFEARLPLSSLGSTYMSIWSHESHEGSRFGRYVFKEKSVRDAFNTVEASALQLEDDEYTVTITMSSKRGKR